MKTILKSLAVGLVVFTMTFTQALMGLAKAGGIHYEGYSGYKPDSSWGYEDGKTRGVMFNFSFGGPEDYKQNSSLQDIYKKSLTTNQKVGFVLGAVGIFVLVLLMTDEEEKCVEATGFTGSQFGPIYGFDPCPSKVPSDRRIKEGIIKIGETHQGLPLYSFRYIGNEKRHIGVMAQDVLKVYPEAVVVGENGYYMVDYGKLGLSHLLLL